ncbi:MAG TPA: isoprenyl transferase [Bacteroidaceae bacterium]|nr:isoprenyl transferase [Bacteroidaceae bacterium]
MRYQDQIDKNHIPSHVAIIMDGNGRWANARGKLRTEGHAEGVNAVRKITEAAVELGIKFLTLYTFSTENWNRPVEEVEALMSLLLENIEEEIFIKNNVKFRVIGDMSKMPDKIIKRLEHCSNKTCNHTGTCLVLALSYSSRWEITNTIRKIVSNALKGEVKTDQINEDSINCQLSTNFMPDPDLLIRTGGEIRLSNFLLWQLAYSELFFCNTLWPDFDKEKLCEAIHFYQQRERRFGLTSAQVAAKKNKTCNEE